MNVARESLRETIRLYSQEYGGPPQYKNTARFKRNVRGKIRQHLNQMLPPEKVTKGIIDAT